MSDFMDGDKFPNRPDHPDFWRMSNVVLRLDGKAMEGGEGLEDTARGLVDLESLVYMAGQRVDSLVRAVSLPTSVRTALITVFITSFITGVEFQKAGGHQ